MLRAFRISCVLSIVAAGLMSGCKDGKPPTWSELTGKSKTGEDAKTENTDGQTAANNVGDPNGDPSQPTTKTESSVGARTTPKTPGQSPVLNAIAARYGSLESCENLCLLNAPANVLAELKQLPNLKTLNLSNCKLDLAAMRALGELKSLVNLKLASASFSGADLEFLKGLVSLRSLDLSATQISDDDLAHIKGLHLDILQVARTQVRGFWFAGKGADKWFGGGLKMIDADTTQFSDGGFVYTKGLTQLEVLQVTATNATDFQMTGLRGCENLRVLTLMDNAISDLGTKELQKLQRLERLDLQGNQAMTEASLNWLTKHKNLVQLTKAPGFGDQALAVFKTKYHPEIVYSGLAPFEVHAGQAELWKEQPLQLQ